MAAPRVDDLARSFERYLRAGRTSPRTIETYLESVQATDPRSLVAGNDQLTVVRYTPRVCRRSARRRAGGHGPAAVAPQSEWELRRERQGTGRVGGVALLQRA